MRPRQILFALALLCCAVCSTGCYYDQRVMPGPDPAPAPEPIPVQAKPGIVGPESVEPGQPLFLSADLEEDSVATWTVESPDGMAFKTFEDQKEFASAGPLDAKEVRVALSVARMEADKLDLKVVRKTITVKGQEPRPDPEPGPNPKPDPRPEPKPTPVGPSYALVIYEKDELATHTNVATLMASDFIQKVVAAGGKARFYDDDHPGAGPQYREELVQRGIDGPGVLVYTLDGKNITDAFPIDGMDKAAVLARLGVK